MQLLTKIKSVVGVDYLYPSQSAHKVRMHTQVVSSSKGTHVCRLVCRYIYELLIRPQVHTCANNSITGVYMNSFTCAHQSQVHIWIVDLITGTHMDR